MVIHYYDNPELLTPRQGSQVVVYWNDHRPEADAAILDKATRRFIGMASYVKPISRFNATDAELQGEAERKAAAMQFARSEIRAIQPHLQRRAANVIPTSRSTDATGEALAEAEARAAATADRQEATRRELRRVNITDADRHAAVQVAADEAFTGANLDALDDRRPSTMADDDISAVLDAIT
jgi:hypothetical protein